jgi:hypothetical protein
MTNRFSEVAFRDWLIGRKFLSKKASGDVVSRLKRCINIEPLGNHTDPTKYFDAILQNPAIENIPESSRNSMQRASRLYFEFAGFSSR